MDHIGGLVTKALERCDNILNITAGFRNCGVGPFWRAILDYPEIDEPPCAREEGDLGKVVGKNTDIASSSNTKKDEETTAKGISLMAFLHYWNLKKNKREKIRI